MCIYAFDIETIPNSSMINNLPEPTVKLGNVKDPEKIAKKIADAKAEQIDKMALSPLYGRVCCAALYNNKECHASTIAQDCDDEERELLETTFSYLADPETRLATWNGNGFDLPFIFKRALLLGVSLKNVPPLSEWTNRYKTDKHVDLMTIWAGYGAYAKLDDIASIINNDRKIEIDFKDFPEMIKTTEGQLTITEYCKQDTKLTYDLFIIFNQTLFK